jgi:endogenous inhibitor of DNA gyrase (YacG/DUF329 family)
VLASEPEFPFCSDRCRVIDLGKWASEAYVISTPANDPESGGEAEYTQRPASSTSKQHSERGQAGHAADSGDSRLPHPNEDRKPN